ncbi:MAG: hypothetical protein KF813_12085 [Trueperaceae bacterium]|nr:hypothetical protein [Trueperaceae bacterium]
MKRSLTWVGCLSVLVLVLVGCGGTPLPDPPAAPTGLTADGGMRTVDMQWNASEDVITHYNVYQGTHVATLRKVAEVPAGSTSHTLTDVHGFTPYLYSLSAVNAGGESPLALAVPATALQTGLVEGQHLALPKGSGRYVEIPHDPALNPTNAITIEGRVQLTAASTSCDSLIGKEYETAYWVGVCNGVLRSYLRGTGSNRDGGTISVGVWTHFAVTSDGTTRRHYLDGAVVAEFEEAGPLTTNSSAVRIGSDVSWDYAPPALFDEFRIWNRALTGTEIQSWMDQEITESLPGLVAVWPLDFDGRDALGSFDGDLAGTPAFGLEGTIDAATPTMPVVLIITPNCTSDLGGTMVRHKVHPFYVDQDAGYTLTLEHGDVALAFIVYEDEFDPTEPRTNCIAAHNDGTPMVLTLDLEAGGPYYAVVFDDTFAQDQDTVYPFSLAGPFFP